MKSSIISLVVSVLTSASAPTVPPKHLEYLFLDRRQVYNYVQGFSIPLKQSQGCGFTSTLLGITVMARGQCGASGLSDD